MENHRVQGLELSKDILIAQELPICYFCVINKKLSPKQLCAAASIHPRTWVDHSQALDLGGVASEGLNGHALQVNDTSLAFQMQACVWCEHVV